MFIKRCLKRLTGEPWQDIRYNIPWGCNFFLHFAWASPWIINDSAHKLIIKRNAKSGKVQSAWSGHSMDIKRRYLILWGIFAHSFIALNGSPMQNTLFSQRSAHENWPNFLRSLGHWPQPRVILILSIGLESNSQKTPCQNLRVAREPF